MRVLDKNWVNVNQNVNRGIYTYTHILYIFVIGEEYE